VDFNLSEEHQILRETVRDFTEKEVAPGAAERDKTHEFPWDLFRKSAELGLTGMLPAEKHGGAAMGDLALTIALIEINQGCASFGVTLSVHNSLCSSVLVKFCNEDQRERYLPKLASGEWLGAYALSEAEAGSDAAALRCFAERKGDRYVLNGTKTWITNGDHAGVMILFARTARTGKARDISAFLVEKDFPGFGIGSVEEKMGIRSTSTAEIVLEDCEVPAENLIGNEGEGFKVAMATLDGGRVGIAAQGIGIAKAALAASIQYAGERVQFGRPIKDFQSIQWKIADMATRIDAAELLTLRAAALRDKKLPHGREAAMAKLASSLIANDAAREAVQIFGGMGYTREAPVERLMRDARITEIYEGTTEIQRIVIARHYLGK
jgi:alkylation response protein AidB-like acyl-CoA dehydrogenase